MNCGLLPLCQESMSLGDISYYDYAGVLSDQEEKDKLTRSLGPSNKVGMVILEQGIVTNHGKNMCPCMYIVNTLLYLYSKNSLEEKELFPSSVLLSLATVTLQPWFTL